MKNVNLKRLCHTAILFAAALALSVLESALTPSGAMAGVKLGLSNVVVMYCLFCLGKSEAAAIVVLKSSFAFLTRGAVSAILSLSGGLVSVFVMAVLLKIFKDKISVAAVSIIGGIFHNIAQTIAAALIINNSNVLYYFPVLLISGAVSGILTGVILKIMLPIFKKL